MLACFEFWSFASLVTVKLLLPFLEVTDYIAGITIL